jgi:hypothetical protein
MRDAFTEGELFSTHSDETASTEKAQLPHAYPITACAVGTLHNTTRDQTPSSLLG